MTRGKPANVNCGRNTRPSSGVKTLTLKQLFSAKLGISLNEPQRLHFHVLILVTRGAGEHVVDFSPLFLKRGNLLLLRAGQVHAFGKDLQLEGAILTFTPEFIGALSHMPAIAQAVNKVLDAGPRIALPNRSAGLLRDWYEEFAGELRAGGMPNAELRIAYAFGLFVNRLISLKEISETSADPETNKPEFVRDFIALLEMSFVAHRDPVWYAKQLRVSIRTLDRRLVLSLKRTCKELIISRLMLESKRLLTDPDLQVKGIAHRLGFEEIASFSRFFRHNAGVAPRDFRSQTPDWPL